MKKYKDMKDFITLEELENKEAELVAEYNENIAEGYQLFADYAIEKLKGVRYVMMLIDGKIR